MILSRSISLFLYKITIEIALDFFIEIALDFFYFLLYNFGVENIIGGAERLRWQRAPNSGT